jgi:MoCo/4Fe-4S cofactor protein with predicted Tat translocation signal
MKRDPYENLRGAASFSEAPRYWRSVEHKSCDPSVVEKYDVEFPSGTAPLTAMQRRDVLKLAGASLALGGLAACVRRPEEEILPYTRQPEEIIPGIANYYATVMPRSEGAVGLVVEAHEGKPTKIEGNALHPASLGAADVWAQSEIIKLYDPDRARSPRQHGAGGRKDASWADWDTFAKTLFSAGGKYAGNGGQGLAILLEDDDSPTFQRILEAGLARMPNARVYRWDPTAPDNGRQGAQLAFGPDARVHLDLSKARVIFSLDSDFLVEGPDHIRLARQFGASRRALNVTEAASMNRLYAAEGVFSVTGSNADHRLRISSAQAGALLRAVAAELSSKHNVALGDLGGGQAPTGTEQFVASLAADLARNRGASVVIAGERQPPAVHALAQAMNVALGAADAGLVTVTAIEGAAERVALSDQLAALTKSLTDGQVETLVVFEANPVYTAPGALAFGEALQKAQTVIHVGVLPDETAKRSTWHVPMAHFLEAWGDARAWDGTAAIVQPLIHPLFDARAPVAVLAQIFGADPASPEASDRKLVEATWRGAGGALAAEPAWRKALHDGVIPGTARPAAASAPRVAEIAAALAGLTQEAPSKDALEFVLVSNSVLDGRLANNGWNQELPDSMTKLCWDNAIVMAPSLAHELGIASAVKKNSYTADVVELTVDGRSIRGPVFVLPGLAPYTLAMARGYGKWFGEVASGEDEKQPVGVNGYPLLGAGRPVVAGVKLTRTGATQELCSTQDHFAVPGDLFKELTFAQMSAEKGEKRKLIAVDGFMDPVDKKSRHRPLLKRGSLKLYNENPRFAHEGNIPANLVVQGTDPANPAKPLQPHSEVTYDGQQWGMVIDLSTCIGCNACTIACQAENNIAVVGRHQVLLGRELHWIRIDRYFSGDVDSPEGNHQPVTCMQCENAPCEPVCPVAATVHDEEGLNSMAYNRCIGTRYCANNCPYKVRRFNYLDFTVTGNVYVNEHAHDRMRTLKLQRNPNVTVRYRGVMEKCTYCTQRIEEAKYAAKRKGADPRALPDGAVTPACAQTCPTDSIVFGNINNQDSRVAAMKQSDRNYEMLQELNVRPRTTYLARLKNTNEELA